MKSFIPRRRDAASMQRGELPLYKITFIGSKTTFPQKNNIIKVTLRRESLTLNKKNWIGNSTKCVPVYIYIYHPLYIHIYIYIYILYNIHIIYMYIGTIGLWAHVVSLDYKVGPPIYKCSAQSTDPHCSAQSTDPRCQLWLISVSLELAFSELV